MKIFLSNTRVQIIIAFLIGVFCAVGVIYVWSYFYPASIAELSSPAWYEILFVMPFAGLFLLLVPFILFVWALEAEIAPGFGLPLHMFTNRYCLLDVGVAFFALACFFLVHATLRNPVARIMAFAFLFLIWIGCGAYLCNEYILA